MDAKAGIRDYRARLERVRDHIRALLDGPLNPDELADIACLVSLAPQPSRPDRGTGRCHGTRMDPGHLRLSESGAGVSLFRIFTKGVIVVSGPRQLLIASRSSVSSASSLTTSRIT